MKLKKFMALGLSTIMTAGMLVGCSGNSENEGEASNGEKAFKVGMITDTGGVNDESFNQSAWAGLQNIEKELGKEKVETSYLESTKDADYAPNIDTYVDQEMDLIIGVGFKLAPAVEKAAAAYPEQKFMIIDGVCENGNPENVTSMFFEDHVSSYLVGLIAGKMTETDKVGFIGGMESEAIEKFKWGYTAGAEEANENVEVQSQYANSFTDAAKGKSMAQTMHSNGVDIIFSAAGGVGIGSIEAAKENNKKAIGVDLDQNALAPANIISSAMKNIDVAVANMVRNFVVDGEFKGGEIETHTLQSGGVGIAPTSDKNVPPDVLELVNEYIEKINAGEIVVPQNEDEYKELNK